MEGRARNEEIVFPHAAGIEGGASSVTSPLIKAKQSQAA